MELDDSIFDAITKLCEQGDEQVEAGDLPAALHSFNQSWLLLPEPKDDWEAATWILSAIGDTSFLLRDYESAIAAMSKAVRCPGGLGNPFIHLRLGEAAFELEDLDKAAEELTRAYMGAGSEIFATEDPKYFAYLKTILRPMPGHETL